MKRFLIFWRFLVFGLVIVLCAGQVGPVHAATLQEMINAAPDGGTVTIPAGDYYETLTVDKNLTLVGESSTTTILHPGPEGPIRGFRVITVTIGHNLNLHSLQITGGHPRSAYGGGVYLINGNLTLISCVIADNSTWRGGGVYQGGAGSVTAINSVFIGNNASFDGGGVYATGSVTLTNTIIMNNNVNEHGGGLYAEGSVNLTNTNLTGNTSGLVGGGLYAAGSVTLTNTNLKNNTAYLDGGGMRAVGPGATLTGGIISGNSATTGSGGGVSVDNFLTVEKAQFANNTSGDTGGGVNCDYCRFTNSRFINNATGTGPGGAIHAMLTFSGENLLFDQNRSPQGAALAIENTASLHYATIARLANYNQDPAIMMASGSTLNLQDTIISSYHRAVFGAGTLFEDYNLLYNNSANFSGVTVTSGGHSISGQNPLFADPAAGDYRLTTLSPARKKGINLGLAYDINGTPRTDPPDIGAYQSWLVINLPAIMR